ncbi:MAG: M48 family metalloprotease [bacterium]
MKHFMNSRSALTLLSLWIVITLLCPSRAKALDLNEEGRTLILEATQAYNTDMRDRPTVTDQAVISYATQIAKRLLPEGKHPPEGVSLSTTVIESPRPELYAYIDGHLVMTTGVLFAMDNEAQLAGVLAHEIAHIAEGYYIEMYQEIKATEKHQRHKAAAGALFGSLLDVAVDYAVEVEDIRQTDRMFSGETTYREAMKRMAAVGAARGAYESIQDVIRNIPAKDENGKPIDPRLQFEAVADAQGMQYLALAGYDTAEAAGGWERIHRINNQLALEQEQALGAWASQLRETRSLMEMNMNRLRQSLGSSGLVQTISDASPSRSQFVARLTELQEVRAAEKVHGREKRASEYIRFLKGVLLPRADQALAEERYDQALQDYKVLYDKGVRNGPVVYGLAKSKLGDFAFGASTAEKKEAESLYREAARLDNTFALPYKGLGELYDDWERYEEAAQAYGKYLKLAPKAKDRSRIERKIKTLERKASR